MKIILVVLLALTAWASSSFAVEIESKVVGCTLSQIVDGSREVLPNSLSFSLGFNTDVPGLRGSFITIGNNKSVNDQNSPSASGTAMVYRIKLSDFSHSDVEVPQTLLGEDSGSTYPVQIRTWPDDGSRSSVVNYNCFVRALVD